MPDKSTVGVLVRRVGESVSGVFVDSGVCVWLANSVGVEDAEPFVGV